MASPFQFPLDILNREFSALDFVGYPELVLV